MLSCDLSAFDANTNKYLSLPYTHLHASITIVDVHAQVCLAQTFINLLANEDKAEGSEAIYTCPLPPASAVCAFEAVWDDGSSTVGTVLAKEDAKVAYEKAKDAGQQAGLVEQLRPDIFTMRVGNIPSGGKTVIKLTYVIELADDGNFEHVRFSLPTSIAPKYSSEPSHSHTDIYTNITTNDQSFHFEAAVEMTQAIQSVSSPSHNISVSPVDNRKMKIKLTSDAKLDKDLVLVIQAKGLDAPRAVAEVHEAPVKKADDVFVERAGGSQKTRAVSLTLVPKFTPSPLPAQEYIFLLDRSGSMQGFKIASLRTAMQLILRSLPPPSVSKTYIQIISFGSNPSALYKSGSVPYDAEALKSAGEHCKKLEANFGGTEMGAALEFAIKGRRNDVPTSLFVLTDGETWNLDECLDKIRTAKKADTGPLRVFSLGIGNEVDQLLVNGLARVGDGVSMFAGENERLDGKVMRLLRAARGSAIRIKNVKWGTSEVSAQEISLKAETDVGDDYELVDDRSSNVKSIFDATHEEEPLEINTTISLAEGKKPILLPPLPSIVVAPNDHRPLYPGVRTTVYALISGEQENAFSGDITITAESELDGEIKLQVPVIDASLTDLTTSGAPLIHVLAARKLLEVWSAKSDSFKPLPSSSEIDQAQEILKAQIVRLAMTYNLASTHTSFVAIKEPKEGEKLVPPKRASREAEIRCEIGGGQGLYRMAGGGPRMMMSRAMPMAAAAPMSPTFGAPRLLQRGAAPLSMGAAFGLRSSAPVPAPVPAPAPAPASCAPPVMAATAYGAPPPTLRGGGATNFALQRAAPDTLEKVTSKLTGSATQDKLDALVEQQAFDGSFTSFKDVQRVLQLSVEGDDVLFATVLALTWIESHNDSGVYTAVLEKGWAWAEASGGSDRVTGLKVKAQDLLAKLA